MSIALLLEHIVETEETDTTVEGGIGCQHTWSAVYGAKSSEPMLGFSDRSSPSVSNLKETNHSPVVSF
jgi:hypothetical protein